MGFVGAAFNYIGVRDGEFAPDASTARLKFPAYTTLNLHVGVQDESWRINLYANNVADERGITNISIYGGIGANYATSIIQPGTVGVTLSKTF